jgi:hypothetical protein
MSKGWPQYLPDALPVYIQHLELFIGFNPPKCSDISNGFNDITIDAEDTLVKRAEYVSL